MYKAFIRMFKDHLSNHKKKNASNFEKQLLVSTRTFGLILIYYFFSIGITFYQKWFIKRFHYPLIVVVCHMFVKYLLAALFRAIYHQFTGITRISLSWKENIRKISLPGVASALDIGFSNWSFEFITISLYTMTKSTCIIFILAFAILFDLEKMRLSLVAVVSFISVGLFMFTYKSTQFQLNGFLLVLSASMLSGLRWTLSQKLMQRKESFTFRGTNCFLSAKADWFYWGKAVNAVSMIYNALSNPLDMMYHVQPWMLVGLFPVAFIFEVLPVVQNYFQLGVEHSGVAEADLTTFSAAYFWQIMHLILIGSILAFLMEFSEYLLLTYTSSLTLSMAGIFKEVFTLYLAVNYNGDQMSQLNFIGLLVCLFGISTHVCLKTFDSHTVAETHATLRPTKTEEFESKRLLEEDVIHFDNVNSNNALSQVYEAKNI